MVRTLKSGAARTPPHAAPAQPAPAIWLEAKALSPGLRSYADAKAADPGITIDDHLRDAECGYSAWTLGPPGFPRSSLSRIDRSA